MLYCCSGRTCLLSVVHSKFIVSRSLIFEPLRYTTCRVPIDMFISQPTSLTNFRIKSNTSTRYTGTAVAQWLRYCATNGKVTVSIPDGVNVIFYWHNPSDRTMALGSTQPLTGMSTRSISWRQRRPVFRADNLTTSLCHCHVIWERLLPGTLWATPCL